MILPFTKIAENEKDTGNIASEFASSIKPGDLIALTGDLGSGKTFFVKAVCGCLGIKNVTSPTFSIVNEYSGKYFINHFDFYRIKEIEELYDLGFEEYLMKENCATFIEWADMYPDILPKDYMKIKIKNIANNAREIKIEKT